MATPNPNTELFIKSCRRTILQMLKQSQSGHPGGSLSSLDFLAYIYTHYITTDYSPVVISNGHISPGVYSVLAELGSADKQEVIDTFRQKGSIYEGHVTRHVPGVDFGTGPLGVGVSAAAGFAWAEKQKLKPQKVYCVFGDGEAQEGQVHEMGLFAAKEKLNNLICFCDYNAVQLTDSLEKTVPIDVAAMFEAYGWNVYKIDGHDLAMIAETLEEVQNSTKPVMIVGETIMGYGVPMMQPDGENHKSTWHGKAPKPDEIDQQLTTPELTLSSEEQSSLAKWVKELDFQPPANAFPQALSRNEQVDMGTPIEYSADTKTDCRSAYGYALLDLAKQNKQVLAGSADLGGSVMTKFVAAELPAQYIEFGICEQNMVSVAGSLSFSSTDKDLNYVPFVSTFGAFMSSRAKDQARVNDINQTNVKMVSTHCGLSVGEDGPTHQAIDDMGSFLGLFNTHVLEPADPNQCDRMVRFAAGHFGNFYIRMGRHKIPNLTKPDGTLLYSEDYEYYYGRTDTVKTGEQVTVLASGPMVSLALETISSLGVSAELIAVSSPKAFDQNMIDSIKKTRKVIVIEDHNSLSGFASQVSLFLHQNHIPCDKFTPLGVREYQLSGKPEELYDMAHIGSKALEDALSNFA